MEMNNEFIKFVPVRGTQAKIDKTKPTDGYVYFATDTGRIFLDKGQSRYSMGGAGGGSGTAAGAAIYYAETPATVVPSEGDVYLIMKDYLSPSDKPRKYDIILNITDGTFFRVLEEAEEWYVCERLAVSGNGTGPSVAGPELEVQPAPASVINGQELNIVFTAYSLLKESGDPRDPELNITYTLVDTATETEYFSDTRKVPHGVQTSINIGSQLRHSSTTTCYMYAKGMNSGQSDTINFDVTTTQMELSHQGFSNVSVFESDSLDFTFNTIGSLNKLFVLTYDKGKSSEYSHTKELGPSDSTYSVHIPEVNPSTGEDCATHGYHSITVDLYQNLGNGETGFKCETLKFEIAVKDPRVDLPIIWLGEYKDTYYAYDDIQIPFMVFDPSSASSVKVEFFNTGVSVGERTITDFSKFDIFEIVDATMDYTNSYSIATGAGTRRQQREVEFKVVPDPVRNMTPVKNNYLMLNFEAKGRSNNDPLSKRVSWTNTITTPPEMAGVTAKLENFNWYNNGWMMDSNKQSMLRISNGATVTFPIGDLVFANPQAASQQSYTFEFQFKVFNVQDYSNLIKNITRYQKDDDKDSELGSWWEAFQDPQKNIWGHQNYDAFLKDFLPPEIYAKLEIDYVYKQMNLNNIVCKYFSPLSSGAKGLAIGAQDAFFSDGSNTVNVNFVEDEMINLSFVYKHSTEEGIDSLIYVYINGVITGVIRSKVENRFSIGSDSLVFMSNSCDIDLYRMRIYKTALDVKDICMNYAIDYKDVDIYDQNGLALHNKLIDEYQFDYNSMIQYNLDNPDNMLMPYIVIDTSNSNNDDKLPHSKATPITADFTFVNTMLDRAYATGELVSLATKDGLVSKHGKVNGVKEYYRHHCPSFVSRGVDLEVQGTSSEYYPRRNYKLKTKMVVGQKPNGKDIKQTQVYLNKGPFADEYKEYEKQLNAGTLVQGEEPSRQDCWYMDNYSQGTDRWTLKVDYMESSGSYNAGFASMIGSAYSKHPLQDYIKTGAINPIVDNENILQSSVLGTMRWEDYRTSLQGFPVMAFHKRSEDNSDIVFIGYYRMLLDKGSDAVLGFDTGDAEQTVLGETAADTTECWEFATNARTFCSYKDPWNRVELSFKSPASIGEDGFIQLEGGERGGPVVLQHFEPRYVANDDYLKNDENGFYNFGSLNQSQVNEMCEELGIPMIDVTADDALYQAQDAAVHMMRNWEAACKWIYSTYLDNVKSQAKNYTVNPDVGIELYVPGKFYVYNVGAAERNEDEYIISNAAYDANTTYYNKKTEDGKTVYENAFVVNDEKNVYKANKFFVEVGGAYSLDRRVDFTEGEIYYEQELLTDAQIAEIADLLVAKATEFDASTEYYTYDPSATVPIGGGKSGAVQYKGILTEEQFNSGEYYVAAPVTYVNTTYKYDTKEYRTAKFINELKDHFDIEYLATYFVATEVFECYDSRGKNCMMASWGPTDYKKGKDGNYVLDADGNKIPGDYIWYPIFYDIDTQLGINNTGIPSFEFNVDASDAGNYSTSDSVLWNNFYKFFKGSSILNKYQQMRNIKQGSFDNLSNPPLKSVDNLEGWYNFDTNTNKMISCRGHRPLIATNLDAYYKYITITNPRGIDTGITGYLDRQGAYTTDTKATYFYALQGDRSQSRRQFLTSRLEYIDSWLNQGNYARGGENCIRGRISANDAKRTSDKWLERNDGYWADKEYGIKKYPFDAEYWVNLTPIRSSYVTLSDDSKAYSAQKYDGINPVQFEITEVKSGVRDSENYPEQLLYIYGMNQMAQVGDMHNLYWREFYIDGDAPKLTKLNLGYDAKVSYVDDNGDTHEVTWYNNKLNQPNIPSAKALGSKGMPLLKEVNLSNIQIQAGSAKATMDFTSCEKLENFRATNSTLTDIKFADGVALHTLYVPSSLASLSLVEANLLTTLIDTYEYPQVQSDGSLLAKRGLYVDKLFDKQSELDTINLIGGGLGYHSHSLLKAFYEKQESKSIGGNITMTKVEWSPYVKVVEGEDYDAKLTYVCDNGHYGFKDYNHVSTDDFNIKVLSGEIYRANFYIKVEEYDDYNANYDYYTMDESGAYVEYAYNADTFKNQVKDGLYYYNSLVETVNDDTVAMLLKFADTRNSYKSASDANVPEITGIIYINNTTKYDEALVIKDELQAAYPELSFFFANEIKTAYSAKFVSVDANTGAEKMVGYTDGRTEPSVQKISVTESTTQFFDNPYTLYNVKQDHWDFYGWSATKPDLSTNKGIEAAIASVITEEEWNDLTLENNNLPTTDDGMSYVFYAILTKQRYDYTFEDVTDVNYKPNPIPVEWGTTLTQTQLDSLMEPYNASISDLEYHYKFKGWVLNKNHAGLYDSATYELVDPTKYVSAKPLTFYAVYLKEKVTDSILGAKYFTFYETQYSDNYDHSYDRQDVCYSMAFNANAATLRGKIALPVVTPKGAKLHDGTTIPEGMPIISIVAGTSPKGITHVFFDNTYPNEYRLISTNAFNAATELRYLDFRAMKNLRIIGNSAFRTCSAFETATFYDPLVVIEGYAFSGAGSMYQDTEKRIDININPMLQAIGSRAIANGFPQGAVTFGAPGKPSELNQAGYSLADGESIFHSTTDYRPDSITIYTTMANEPMWNGWLYGTSKVDLLIASKSGTSFNVDNKG